MKRIVLAYHRVATLDQDIHRLAVTPEDFRDQMSWVASHCAPVPLTELVDSAGPADRSVAVTLDDGYLDNFTNASGILADLGVPATFFVTTERLDDATYEYWWDRLARMLLRPHPGRIELVIDTKTARRSFAMDTDENRLEAYRVVHRVAADARVDVRDRILDVVASWAGHQDASPRNRRMITDELRALAIRPGHAIGVHTERHLFLPAQSPAVQSLEIERSTQTLERVLGARPNAIAYPFGVATAEAVDAADRLGFRVGVTIEQTAVTEPIDPLRIPRLEVTPSRSARFGEWLESMFDAA